MQYLYTFIKVPTACVWGLDNHRRGTVVGLKFENDLPIGGGQITDPLLYVTAGIVIATPLHIETN